MSTDFLLVPHDIHASGVFEGDAVSPWPVRPAGGVPSSWRGWARREISRLVENYRPAANTGNLKKDEWEAVNELRDNKDIRILPADKGNAAVVLNDEDYNAKLLSVIEDGPYARVQKDPGPLFRRQLYDILKPVMSTSRLERCKFLRLCPTHFQCPYIYGLPKIHKLGTPLRPIVSMVGSLFSNVSRFLSDLLTPYAANASCVLNSTDAVQRLTCIEDVSVGRLVSFDVVNLFSNVPVDEALEVIENRLSSDDSLTERTNFEVEELISLLRFCLTKCYFVHQGRYFIQTGGVAMGGSVSVVVANIFMIHFESVALSSARNLDILTPNFGFASLMTFSPVL